jgi:hypothetical protein
VETIHVIVEIYGIKSYVSFHNDLVTYAIAISIPIVNHVILVSLEPIKIKSIIPHCFNNTTLQQKVSLYAK